MWAAGGLMDREGAAKRRMLSLAESPPSVEVEACAGVLPLMGAADGMVTVAGSMDGGWESSVCEQRVSTQAEMEQQLAGGRC